MEQFLYRCPWPALIFQIKLIAMLGNNVTQHNTSFIKAHCFSFLWSAILGSQGYMYRYVNHKVWVLEVRAE